MERRITWWQPAAILAALALFYTLLFYTDNKYQTPPPYGKSGIIALDEKDFERKIPIFLIDGWLLTDERVTNKPVYIGEFSNLSRGDLTVSPHGKACYRLILQYHGTSQIVSIDFPRLSSEHVILLDGIRLSEGSGNGRITFLLDSGEHVLEVETSSESGYYSGIYFPPALGKEETLFRINSLQNFAYALAFLLPLSLAVFTLFLWRTGGEISRCFGLLCCNYALYMFRHFVFLFSMPWAKYWFLIQSLTLYCLCFYVVKLIAVASGGACGKAWRRMRQILLTLSAFMLAMCLLIPILPWAVFIHGKVTDIYYLFTFGCTAFFAIQGIMGKRTESHYTLAGCFVFGAGLLVNLFLSNQFEPIRFFWQFEWSGLLLVLLFGAMMVSYSRRIVRENEVLTNHLEEQVKVRTQEVTQLLKERKAFFSDMAHDLKAPVFATQAFIKAIRESGLGVDMEMRSYLDLAEEKQREMARRLQGLSAINEFDKIEEARTRLSLREMLAEIYETHRGEADVWAVHLTVEIPKQDAFLMAQPKKIDILFENLIYNALRATPRNGKITISARIEDRTAYVEVEDTGCGIPEEELPHIFERFYVGQNNKDTGTGLGLYVAHSIMSELGGTIGVSSAVGIGTKFVMEFPCC